MRPTLILCFLLFFAVMSGVYAKTPRLTLKKLVRDSDAIIEAIAITEPEHDGSIMFARPYSGHLWWDVPPYHSTPTQVTNGLATLVELQEKLAATSSNYYASQLLNIPLWHHQRVWKTKFLVITELKGHALTNITVRLGLPYRSKETELEKGEPYILFLQQRFAKVYTPGEFTLQHLQKALPVTNKYVWDDDWTTLENDEEAGPLAPPKKEKHRAMRTFTHKQFLTRIREIVKEQEEKNDND